MLSFKNYVLQTLSEAYNPDQVWAEHGPKILDRLKKERPNEFKGKPESQHHEVGRKLLHNFVQSADPTPNKTYGNWISRTYAAGKEGGIGHVEDTGQVNDLVSSFHNKAAHVKNLGLERNIDNYGSIDALRKTVDKLPLSKSEKKAKEKAGRAETRTGMKTLTDDFGTYLFPKTKDEAVAGALHPDGTKRCEWCTATPVEEHNRFSDYHKDNDPETHLVIVRPHKGKPGEMYQWQPSSGEFMNRNNRPAPRSFDRIMSKSSVMRGHLKNLFLGTEG